MDALTPVDLDLLESLLAGGTIAGYARAHDYSRDWGKWKSREIRRKLGVDTIEEALAAMRDDDDDGVSRADFDKLTGMVGKLGEALEELTKRPGDAGAQQNVRERELDVKDHAKALGLSLEDVEKLKGEKEYERFKAMQDRLDAERAAEDDDEDDENGNGAGGLGQQIRDGLGGIRNVKP
jgi:hypothetical protein